MWASLIYCVYDISITDKHIWLWDEVKMWYSSSRSRSSSSSTLNILCIDSRNYFPPNDFFFKIMYIWNKLSTAPSTTTKGRVIQSDNPFCHKISRLQLLLSESRWLAPSSLELSNSFCYTTFQFNYLQDMTCFTFSQMLNFNFNSNLILIGANLTVTYQHFWWWKF